MNTFLPLFLLGLRKRSKDSFILFYNILFPTIIILLLGYLTQKSYSKEFTSYQYYTLVIIPFCALMGIITVAYVAKEDKLSNTSCRLLTAPTSNAALVLAKFLSSFIILALCNIITLGLNVLLYQLPIARSFIPCAVLLTLEAAVVTGIGLNLGYAFHKMEVLKNFLNLPIMLGGLTGGSFFPIASDTLTLTTLRKLSPMTYINRSIFEAVYDNQHTLLTLLVFIFTLLSILLLFLTIKHFKKEAIL
ncbi:transport permease protein [Anaerocolumna cellulosilytica]|uniref:Transport permease protein n=1 Tax=Anaerocolumna cellulosilytica TaxID=433286 RepID=A0A6S6R3Q7_9FIRM|nr:ABC transporter permease [Anaerocolumna cellulosilytica]MBB5195520.1 ABC-2 type transport system permease protein [Anaerocolumna cellulosilytica]BCJ93761.1 transport permease protein [Anaerocolumna cellulosilytica]